MLTSRQKQIVSTLLDKSEFVPVSEVAAALSVSGRTVMRELDALEYDLKKLGVGIERKSSQGVRLLCPKENTAQLRDAVFSKTKLLLCSKEERRQYILSTLLKCCEPVKTYVFTNALGVTDTTVSADLDRCEQWLERNHIQLVRKPGVGVYLNADEWDLRRGMLNLFYDTYTWQDIIVMLTDQNELNYFAEQDIMDFLDADLLWTVRRAAEEEKRLRVILQADKDYYEFLITVFYMVRRVMGGNTIVCSQERMAEWMRSAEYPVIMALLQKLQAAAGAELPEDEADYLMLLLQASHGRMPCPAQPDERLQALINEIIRIAESETGYILESNSTFYHGLCEHLIPAINRLRMHLEIRNPLLKSVKAHYPHLYALAKTCIVPLERELGVTVPEEEIAYIAMHLGVALEDKNLQRNRVFRAVVCCPAGMVSAQFLATLLVREFGNLLIAEILATTNISEQSLVQRGVDIVISTVPIPGLRTPNITVSPFLLENDRAQLRALLKNMARQHTRWEQAGVSGIKERLSDVKNIIDGILQVLDNFFLIDGVDMTHVQDIIAFVAAHVGETPEQAAQIEKALFEREKYGSTIDFGSGCMLLHCRTAGVTELRFGIIRNDGGVLYSCGGKPLELDLVLVMLAPMQCPGEYISVMGAISQGIINYDYLVHAFKTGGRADCYAALERLMSAYQSDYFMITGKEQE